MVERNEKKEGTIKKILRTARNAFDYMLASRMLPSTVTVPPMMRHNPILYAMIENWAVTKRKL